MTRAIALRQDYTASELRQRAAKSKHANQSRRLLSIAAVYDGLNRTQAAKIGGMDRQTLRDWVHWFNAEGPEGLRDHWHDGPPRKLSGEQRAAFAGIVAAGPDLERDGVVRWRRCDLKAVIAERFDVVYSLRSVGRLLHEVGFSHISARPKHPAQDEAVLAAYKKTSPARLRPT
jgi:transposase